MIDYDELREEVFDLIDEYNDLKNDSYKIQITGAKKDKVKAFGILMKSAQGFGSDKKEVYIINGIIKRLLDKQKIKYKYIWRTKRK